MSRPSDEDRLLSFVPDDGATIGNKKLCDQLGWEDEKYWRVRERLIEKGVLAKAPGGGGAVRRTSAADTADNQLADDSDTGSRHRRTHEEIFFDHVPEDGSNITNPTLGERLGWDDEKYARIRDRLVEKNMIIRGPGPGGTLRRAEVTAEPEAPKPNLSDRQRLKTLLSHIPKDGSSIGNKALLEVLGWDADTYTTIRDQLVETETILKGGGPGGTVRRAIAEPDDPNPQRTERQRITRESSVPKPSVGRPKVFIGSSSEGLDIAEAIQMGLDHDAECTIWTQGVFGLGSTTLDALLKRAKQSDWAVLVLTPDDLVNKRDKNGRIPRDNVIFELGLFMGALGRERTFMVYNRDIPMELPSDLAGVTPATYKNHSDNNRVAELGAVCTKLKTAIKT